MKKKKDKKYKNKKKRRGGREEEKKEKKRLMHAFRPKDQVNDSHDKPTSGLATIEDPKQIQAYCIIFISYEYAKKPILFFFQNLFHIYMYLQDGFLRIFITYTYNI